MRKLLLILLVLSAILLTTVHSRKLRGKANKLSISSENEMSLEAGMGAKVGTGSPIVWFPANHQGCMDECKRQDLIVMTVSTEWWFCGYVYFNTNFFRNIDLISNSKLEYTKHSINC